MDIHQSPTFCSRWEYYKEKHKECLYKTGYNPYNFGSVVCLIDRKGEDQFLFNTNTPLIKWIPFQEYPKQVLQIVCLNLLNILQIVVKL